MNLGIGFGNNFRGSTWVRFLIREPVRGISENLIKKDVEEENLFSSLLKEEKIGHFCYNTEKLREIVMILNLQKINYPINIEKKSCNLLELRK